MSDTRYMYKSKSLSSKTYSLLKKNHSDFMRNILKMESSTQLVMVYGEFGLYPLEIQVKVRMVPFWSKLLTGKTAKYHLKCIYFNCTCIEIIYYIWLGNNDTNIIWLCRELQNRLQKQYIQNWNSDVYNSPKCIKLQNV